MNNNTNGAALAFAICCVWPFVANLLVIAGWRFLINRDWRAIFNPSKWRSEE